MSGTNVLIILVHADDVYGVEDSDKTIARQCTDCLSQKFLDCLTASSSLLVEHLRQILTGTFYIFIMSYNS